MKRGAIIPWLLAFASVLAAGCESLPDTQVRTARPLQGLPSLRGSYHTVRRGETLWRIARSYGLNASILASANRLAPHSALNVGQQLFIPLPSESRQFLWPVRGAVRTSSASHGLEISAPTGSLVRASRSGRVAVATHHLSGWGRTVVVDHLDGYVTIYAGLDQILVAPGAALNQGIPLGSVGSRPVHFEIRHGTAPKNALALLPRE